MRRPRVRITIEWVGITKQDVMVLVVVMAVAMVLARGWCQGASVFGFESPYWDLGLIPILTALVLGACRVAGCDSRRRRFLLGFEAFGLAAVAAYFVSCSRPARWSLVSALLPFQTGLMLAPDVGASWKGLKLWNILVDTVILASLPFLVAAVGGAMFSVRFTLRRIAVAVAVIAAVLAVLVGIGRRIRRFDDLATYHRAQIVSVVYTHSGPDGTSILVPSSVDWDGKPVTSRQQALDRWHLQMYEEYLRAARYPWLDVTPDGPPTE
jgi:hypothetical protein